MSAQDFVTWHDENRQSKRKSAAAIFFRFGGGFLVSGNLKSIPREIALDKDHLFQIPRSVSREIETAHLHKVQP